jgi:hypothetical protein
MKRGLVIFALLALGLCSLLLWGPRLFSDEPYHKGRSLRSWIRQCASAQPGDKRGEEARKALRAIGTNAVPYLVKQLDQDLRPWQQAWNRLIPLGAHSRWGFFHPSDAASYALGELGPDAVAAVPRLIEKLATPWGGGSPHPQARALLEIGPPAVPYLVAALKHTNWSCRFEALWVIQSLDATNSAPLIPHVVSLFRDPDEYVRERAARRLTWMSGDPWFMTMSLLPNLDDPDPEVRRLTFSVLHELGPKAQAAVPKLTALTRSSDRGLAEEARRALQAITAKTSAPH